MSRFIAALPMYDWPERRAEVDAEWATMRDGLRARGVDAPEALTRRNADMPAVPGGIRDADGRVIAPDPASLPSDELDFATLWRHPALLLAQTCWGPMETTDLARHVRVVGQPDYSAFDGGEGEFYRSAIVMRASPSPLWGGSARSAWAGIEGQSPPPGTSVRPPHKGEVGLDAARLRNLRFAFNDRNSMSGHIALARDLAAAGEIAEDGFASFWSELVETGAHRASVRAVADGRADVAAIDCRSWAYCLAFEPAAKELTVAGWTAPRLGLPFITSRFSPLASL